MRKELLSSSPDLLPLLSFLLQSSRSLRGLPSVVLGVTLSAALHPSLPQLCVCVGVCLLSAWVDFQGQWIL